MDYNSLLEKYWEGETSLEEEKMLRVYFNSTDVAPDLILYKPFFLYQKVEQEKTLSDNFEQELLAKIELEEKPIVKINRKQNVTYYLYRIAAALALLFGVWFLFKPVVIETEQIAAVDEDTFDDPEEAFNELKSALLLVSRNFEKGKSESMKGVIKINTLRKTVKK